MLKKRLVVLVLLITTSWVAIFAQDVEFTVSAPNVVAVGEQFRVVYKLNARPQEFNPPAFDKFYILAGPSTSSSSSIQIINGQMTQTYEFSYTYILEATAEGQFTIESATAVVSKKEYRSDPLEIEVVKSTTGQSQAPQRNMPDSQAQIDKEQADDEIFVAVEFDKQTAFRGQPILATIKIYTREGISSFEEVKFPSFTGFWSQEVETPNNVTFQRVNVNGRIYNMGILKKYLLFPQRTGDVTVEPFEIVVLSQQRGGRPQSIFDEFFGSFQTVRRQLKSKAAKLKIRDLPQNAPASFTGAVGNFNIEASFDKESLKTNEAVNLTVRIAGSGNLKLIERPSIDFPGGFEVFDPKISDRINTSSQGATGSRTFEFVAIPRAPGKYNLGSLEFSYFDPLQSKYITLKSKPLDLQVEADGSDQSGIQMAGFGREDIKFIGQDIRFIKTEGFKLTKNSTLLFASSKYYFYLALLLIIFMVSLWFIQEHRKLMGNIALVRTRKANKMAKRRLKQAQKYLDLSQSEQFHDELLKAMWGYVSDKLSIPVANLSSESASETLSINGVEETDIVEFMRIVSACEYARYAPKSESLQMNELYQSAMELITKLDEIIGK